MNLTAVTLKALSKRDLMKIQTRRRILRAAKQLFVRRGFLNTRTIDIASRAKVAQGTVFFHFDSMENLVLEIIDQKLVEITDKLYVLLQDSVDLEDMLSTYLDFIESEEDFLSTIARETPYYDQELRRRIIVRECAIRNYFFQALQNGIDNKTLKHVDITTALSILFGTINYLLAMKHTLVTSGSVIKEKKNMLKQTLLLMLTHSTKRTKQ